MSLTEIEEGFLKVVKSATPYNSNEEIKLYRVGGYVRDKYLEIPSKDVDYVVTNVTFDELCRVLRNSYGKVIDTEVGDSMNVIKVHIEGYELFDFAIPRKDIYGNSGNHTDLVTIGNPSMKVEDDLSRRDITINAIAQDVETNEIIDPFGGVYDIKHEIIKCVGDPKERFTEDALRILRAIQFAVRFNFNIEENTFKAIKSNVELLDNISGERIDGEFIKAFTKSKDPSNRKLYELLLITNIGEYLFNLKKPYYSDADFLESGVLFSPHCINRAHGNDKVLVNYVSMFAYGGDYLRLKLPSKTNELIEIFRDYYLIGAPLKTMLYRKSHYREDVYNILKSMDMSSDDYSYIDEYLDPVKIPLEAKELKISSQEIIDAGFVGKNISKVQLSMLSSIWDNELVNEIDELRKDLIRCKNTGLYNN